MAYETVEVLPHNYDGIEEFDNRLPNWWLFTLFGAVVFALCYWAYYEGFGVGATSMDEFNEEQAVAKAEADIRKEAEKQNNPISDDSLAALMTNSEALAAGQAAWTANCVACHADKGQGLVGPNLTDAFFIHGASPLQIRKIIANGVPTKGMPAWETVLGGKKVTQLTAFVLTMKGKNIKGKAPQGDETK